MMSVGIITIHGINNFGSVFQAYALQETISQMGYDVQIIDYTYPNVYHKKSYIINNPYSNNKITLNKFDMVRNYIYRLTNQRKDAQKRKQKFQIAIHSLLRLSENYPDITSLKKCNGRYEIYVTGSDQVWNPRYLIDDTSFLLPFTDSVNKIAYSASFGTTTLSEKYSKLYTPLLQKYRFISTREKSGVDIVQKLTRRECICTCDPTLLLDSKEWNSIVGDEPLIKGKYILCYVLSYTANPFPYAYELIKAVKEKLGYKVICIDTECYFWMKFGYTVFTDCGPIDILNLFAHASFVLSSSFHGAAFSINFKKDFFSILPPNINDERQESLLRIVGADDRIIRVGDPMPTKITMHHSSWDNISHRLEEYRNNSLVYLQNALNSCSHDKSM